MDTVKRSSDEQRGAYVAGELAATEPGPVRVAVVIGSSPLQLEEKTNYRLADIEAEGGEVVDVKFGPDLGEPEAPGFAALIVYRPSGR